MTETPTVERRKSALTHEDIQNIALAVVALQANQHNCPVAAIELTEAINFYKNMNKFFGTPDNLIEVGEAMKFYKNINQFFGSTGNIIWKTVIVATVMGLMGLIATGFYSKTIH